MSLTGKKILVGLTGGIACYKVPYFVRALIKDGAEVQVMMTDSATKFITPLTLESISRRQVAVDMFPVDEFVATRHIDLAEWPDLVVVAPATANFLGKVSSGISDDLLTTTICAVTCPVVFAPAMNPNMWANRVTQRNATFLRDELGWTMIGPAEGDMACEAAGVGRLVEPDELHQAVVKALKSGRKKKALTGKRFLVTAGPCREAIDPVRFISNRSSGKMGFALAVAARDAGAEVVLISGPSNLPTPQGVDRIDVETTAQMANAVQKQFAKCDCLIMSAAPADFAPARQSSEKIKKADQSLTLELAPTIDILKSLRDKKKPRQIVVGFALESDDGLDEARRKLKDKGLDYIVLNSLIDQGAGFDVDTNAATILSKTGKPVKLPLASKAEIAEHILQVITRAVARARKTH